MGKHQAIRLGLNKVRKLRPEKKPAKRKGQFMKILLQHARTRLFLRGLGDWTANHHEGFDFQHSQKAIDFAQQHSLTSVQIAVKFIDGQFDETFPLPAVAATAPVQQARV